MKQLGRVLEEDNLDALPHPSEVLSSMVIFSLRIGDITDLNKWLPQARLRPHVVLKLCCALLDAGYPFKESAHSLREKFGRLVAQRYPETEAHLPEDERQGSIPPEIEQDIVSKRRRPSHSLRLPDSFSPSCNVMPRSCVINNLFARKLEFSSPWILDFFMINYGLPGRFLLIFWSESDHCYLFF